MGKFDGYLLGTDLDGTLLRKDKTISDENKAAIEYFKSEGGIFTFFTGRLPIGARPVLEQITPNGYVGCANGAGIFDAKTEKLLQDGLDILLEGRTSFIIAHRLSTIRNCDKIMYVSNKGITECGTHDELIAKKGDYYKLYTASLTA